MRYTQAEKMQIIRLVEASDLSIRRTLNELGVPRFLLPMVPTLPGRRV